MKKLCLGLIILSLCACGVKSELLKPDGKATEKSERDPSQPPQPIGK